MPEILIYEDIGADYFGDGVTAKSIHQQLSEIDGDLTIRINSLGGDVFEGHAIYNLIRGYSRGTTTAVVDGIAASAASVIAMGADEVVMPPNAMLMIHDPWTFAVGNSADMLKTAEILETIKQTIVSVYVDKTGLESSEVSDMMSAETWLEGSAAEELGFARTDEAAQMVLNKTDCSRQWINAVPEKIQPRASEAVSEPTKEYPNLDARRRFLETQVDA